MNAESHWEGLRDGLFDLSPAEVLDADVQDVLRLQDELDATKTLSEVRTLIRSRVVVTETKRVIRWPTSKQQAFGESQWEDIFFTVSEPIQKVNSPLLDDLLVFVFGSPEFIINEFRLAELPWRACGTHVFPFLFQRSSAYDRNFVWGAIDAAFQRGHRGIFNVLQELDPKVMVDHQSLHDGFVRGSFAWIAEHLTKHKARGDPSSYLLKWPAQALRMIVKHKRCSVEHVAFLFSDTCRDCISGEDVVVACRKAMKACDVEVVALLLQHVARWNAMDVKFERNNPPLREHVCQTLIACFQELQYSADLNEPRSHLERRLRMFHLLLPLVTHTKEWFEKFMTDLDREYNDYQDSYEMEHLLTMLFYAGFDLNSFDGFMRSYCERRRWEGVTRIRGPPALIALVKEWIFS